MTKFALLGNGPLSNKGCEAIVYSTVDILNKEFGDSRYLLASFADDSNEKLPKEIEPLSLPYSLDRWSKLWWKYRIPRLLGRPENKAGFLKQLEGHLDGVQAALSIGGDGYAIEYGHTIVDRLIIMDDHIHSLGIPVIIWGASIGPFDKEPQFEKRMAEHFSKIDLIVVREPASYRYLQGLGLDKNVRLAPDPAFALEARECSLPWQVEQLLSAPCIGVNLSPLLARNVTGGDLKEWVSLAANALSQLIYKTDMPVLLIPHVINIHRHPLMDDELFLRNVMVQIPEKQRTRVALVPAGLSSKNLKWIIAQTTICVGARMHATIAALSMNVPCLSIAYSIKAWGINEYVFGHKNWVVSSNHFDANEFCNRILEVLSKKDQIRSHLLKVIPSMIASAFNAAKDIRMVSQD